MLNITKAELQRVLSLWLFHLFVPIVLFLIPIILFCGNQQFKWGEQLGSGVSGNKFSFHSWSDWFLIASPAVWLARYCLLGLWSYQCQSWNCHQAWWFRTETLFARAQIPCSLTLMWCPWYPSAILIWSWMRTQCTRAQFPGTFTRRNFQYLWMDLLTWYGISHCSPVGTFPLLWASYVYPVYWSPTLLIFYSLLTLRLFTHVTSSTATSNQTISSLEIQHDMMFCILLTSVSPISIKTTAHTSTFHFTMAYPLSALLPLHL